MFLGLLSCLWASRLRPSPELVAGGHCPLFKNTPTLTHPRGSGKGSAWASAPHLPLQPLRAGRVADPRANPGPITPQPPPTLAGVRAAPWARYFLPFLTLASKKLLAPLTPSVDTSISERRASTCSPLSSCSSPAAALRKIRRNCRGEESGGVRARGKGATQPQPGLPGRKEVCSRAWGPEVWVLPFLSGPRSAHLHNGRLGDPAPALPGCGATAGLLVHTQLLSRVLILGLGLPLNVVSNVPQTNSLYIPLTES